MLDKYYCKQCAHKLLEICKLCRERIGKVPSMFKPIIKS